MREYISVGHGRSEHQIIAERVLGRALPEGAQVHHVDYNGRNNSTDNLVICPSYSYHRLLHRRTDAMAATGNPNARKCWICKKCDDPSNLAIYPKKNLPDTASVVHRACDSANHRKGKP